MNELGATAEQFVGEDRRQDPQRGMVEQLVRIAEEQGRTILRLTAENAQLKRVVDLLQEILEQDPAQFERPEMKN